MGFAQLLVIAKIKPGFEVGRCGSFLSGFLSGFLVGFSVSDMKPTGLAQLGPTQIEVSSLGGAQLGSHHEPSWGPAGAHMGMLAGKRTLTRVAETQEDDGG